MKNRQMTIVWKITIWYAIFFGILSIVVAFISLKAGNYFIGNNIRSELIEDVEEVLSEFEYDDGMVQIDDEIDLLKRGTYLSVYYKGNRIEGYLPKHFDQDTKFELGKIKMVVINGTNWLMYEEGKDLLGVNDVIVRGIVSINTFEKLYSIYKWMILILFPTILFVAVIGGYRLTKRAMQPVKNMRQIIEVINNGDDLTKRLNFGEGEDELYRLAHAFDCCMERLEESFEREKQFTSDVSHELRTPVSVILSQCEYALEHTNNDETQWALEGIYQQTLRMSKMIQQLLMLTRQEQEKEFIPFEMVCVSEILALVVQEANEKAEKKKIKINTRIEPDLWILGDETLMIRFFMNLLQNAIQYSNVHSKIEIELYENENDLTGFVKDYGIGIAKEHQKLIFKRLYRVSSERTITDDTNSGLGLSMVEFIAKKHQGEVWVESELGVGSTFFFRFPKVSRKNNVENDMGIGYSNRSISCSVTLQVENGTSYVRKKV